MSLKEVEDEVSKELATGRKPTNSKLEIATKYELRQREQIKRPNSKYDLHLDQEQIQPTESKNLKKRLRTHSRSTSARSNSKNVKKSPNKGLQTEKTRMKKHNNLNTMDLGKIRSKIIEGETEDFLFENWILCDDCRNWRKITDSEFF